MKISIIGLGKLGTCLAATLASKGFEIIGIDVNRQYVDSINNGHAHVYEPGLQELITAHRANLSATQNYAEALRQTDMTILILPTPVKSDGHFSESYLQAAFVRLSEVFKEMSDKRHLFVVTSTVSPGTIEKNLIPLIESVSGKKLNKDFAVCYNPAFIALGSAVQDFFRPDMVLIGESQPGAGDALVEIYKTLCDNEPSIVRMSIINAEITKLSLDAYISMKISFANTLGSLCELVPGADADVITYALGLDKRISPYFIKSGLSFGGPCLPNDNRAFLAFSQKQGFTAELAKATDEVNIRHLENIKTTILNLLSSENHRAIAFLGMAYKPKTPVIDGSPVVELVQKILHEDRGKKIVVYDPLAQENLKTRFGGMLEYASSIQDCFTKASLCIISGLFEGLKMIDDSYIFHNPTTILDCWRILDSSKLGSKAKYIVLGRSREIGIPMASSSIFS